MGICVSAGAQLHVWLLALLVWSPTSKSLYDAWLYECVPVDLNPSTKMSISSQPRYSFQLKKLTGLRSQCVQWRDAGLDNRL